MNFKILNNLAPVMLFTFVSITCGWFGRFVDSQSGQTGTQTLGTLIWLLTPVTLALALRITQKNKFVNPNFGYPFYKYLLISLLFYPVVIGFTLVISVLFGGYALQSFVFKPEIFIGILISALIKNLFEEFAWRGYLTPKLDQVGVSRLNNHILTGLVWGLWHLPYFLMLNPTLVISSTVDYIIYCIQFLISVIAVSWLYGELRLQTGKIWLGYILHVVVNIITATIIIFGILKSNPGVNTLIFSLFDGLVYNLIAILVTTLIFTHNKKSTSVGE